MADGRAARGLRGCEVRSGEAFAPAGSPRMKEALASPAFGVFTPGSGERSVASLMPPVAYPFRAAGRLRAAPRPTRRGMERRRRAQRRLPLPRSPAARHGLAQRRDAQDRRGGTGGDKISQSGFLSRASGVGDGRMPPHECQRERQPAATYSSFLIDDTTSTT